MNGFSVSFVLSQQPSEFSEDEEHVVSVIISDNGLLESHTSEPVEFTASLAHLIPSTPTTTDVEKLLHFTKIKFRNLSIFV